MDSSLQFFKHTQVASGVWAIDGPANDLMYLVIGSRKAMLVDTGMGSGDLAAEVGSLTNLPVVVVNTHGHPDHAGGNSNFPEVWLPEKDEPIRRVMCTREYRANDLRAVLGGQDPAIPGLVAGLVPDKPFKALSLQPGQIFDLGDRFFEVLETPGHTPGSICLLNVPEKMLFSGDTIVSTPAWLYLRHSLPLEVYRQSLLKIKAREAGFEQIFPGHQPTPIGRDHLEHLLWCVEEVLGGSGVGEPVRTFAGEGLLWSHGRAQVIYDPLKLR